MSKQRRLCTNLCSRVLNPLNGFLNCISRKFNRMVKVCLKCEMLTCLFNLLKESKHIIGIFVGNKTIRPIRECLGPNTYCSNMVKLFCQQRLYVGGHDGGFCCKRISSSEKDIGHFR